MPFKPFAETPTKKTGAVENFVRGMFSPVTNYASMVGEAAGSLGRFATDPVYRKAAMGEKLTPEEGQHLAQLKTMFMNEADTSKFNTVGGAALEGTKRIAGMDAMLIPGSVGLKGLGGVAASGALSGGLLGYADSEGIDPKSIFTGAATGAVLNPAMHLFGQAVGSGAKRLAKGIGPELEKQGKNWATRGIGNPGLQKKMTRNGVPLADLFEMFPELYSRDKTVAEEVKNKVGKEFTQAFMRPDIKIDPAGILKNFDDKIADLAAKAERGSEIAGVQAEKLKVIREQIASELSKNPTLEGLGLYKRDILQPNMPKGTFDPNSYGGNADAYKFAYGQVKDAGIAANPELRAKGKIYHTLKELPTLFENSQVRADNRQPINFTKFGGATVGGIAAGAPGAIGGFVAEQTINSPEGVRAISQGMQRAGKAIGSTTLPRIEDVAPEVLAKVIKRTTGNMPLAGAVSAQQTQQNPYTAPVQVPEMKPTPGFKPITGPQASLKMPVDPKAKLPTVKPMPTVSTNYNLGSTNFSKVKKLTRSAAY